MTHQIKCESRFFREIVEGRKKLEVRYDDRDYRVADELELLEIEDDGQPRNKMFTVVVTYVLSLCDVPGFPDVSPAWVVLGIEHPGGWPK